MNQDDFDLTIGRLDRILSELMGFAKNGINEGGTLFGKLDEANQQTLKHHIEDMELLAAAIRKRCGFGPNGQLGTSDSSGPEQCQDDEVHRIALARRLVQPISMGWSGLLEVVGVLLDYRSQWQELSDKLFLMPGAPCVRAAVEWYIEHHNKPEVYKTQPDASVRSEHAQLTPRGNGDPDPWPTTPPPPIWVFNTERCTISPEVAGRCKACDTTKCQGPSTCGPENHLAGVDPAKPGTERTVVSCLGPDEIEPPWNETKRQPPELGDYAAVWNGLMNLTLPGNPLAALNGVPMAEFPERLGEWIAGFEEYPYNHASELEAAVKSMLDAIEYQGDRLVGVMFEAHNRLKEAYHALPEGDTSPSLRQYAQFWLDLRALLMQPGKPCHGLAMVHMPDVPQALYDFIAGLMEQVEMANARAHGLGLLSQRLTKKLGKHAAPGWSEIGGPWIASAHVQVAQEPVTEAPTGNGLLDVPALKLTNGVPMIAAERLEQLQRGFTPEIDSSRSTYPQTLVQAAWCYALEAVGTHEVASAYPPRNWPWAIEWWKPSTPERNLTKAGALIAAAIDVIQYRARGG